MPCTGFTSCCVPGYFKVENNTASAPSIVLSAPTFNQTGIEYNASMFPYTLPYGECFVFKIENCNNVIGASTLNMTMNYSFACGSATCTGQTTGSIDYFKYAHPLDLFNTTCAEIDCPTDGFSVSFTNSSPIPLTLYHYMVDDPAYNLDGFLTADKTNPFTVPASGSLTVNFSANTNVLLGGANVNNQFTLRFFDPCCCRVVEKCINVNTSNLGFFPSLTPACECNPQTFYGTGSTQTTGYLPPTAAGVCDGQMGVLLFGGNPPYTYVLSGATTQNGTTSETELTFTGLCTGYYKLTVTDSCGSSFSYTNLLPSPDPLGVVIVYKNRDTYCKDDYYLYCETDSPCAPDEFLSGSTVVSRRYLHEAISGHINYPTRYPATQVNDPVANRKAVDPINNFHNYIVNFAASTNPQYKQKTLVREEVVTMTCREWLDRTFGQGCCYVATITGGTAPYSISWTDANNTEVGTTNVLVNQTCCTPRTITVTDAYGYTVQATATCLAMTGMTFTASQITQPTTIYQQDGVITFSIYGGEPPYNVSFTGPKPAADVSLGAWTPISYNGLPAGTYTVTITDENECSERHTYTLVPDNAFRINYLVTGTTCATSKDGAVAVLPQVLYIQSGCTPTYQYSFDGGPFVSSSEFVSLAPGFYDVTVAETCSGTFVPSQVYVPNTNAFSVTVAGQNPTPHNADGILVLTVEGGTSTSLSAETYTVNGMTSGFTNGSLTLPGRTVGSSTFTITDAKGCTVTLTKKLFYDQKRTVTRTKYCCGPGGTNCIGSNTTIKGSTIRDKFR